MRAFRRTLMTLFLCVLLTSTAFGYSAQSAILLDADSGTILESVDPDRKMAPASTTKLMTALCASRMLNGYTRVFTVSSRAACAEGSSIYLKAGEQVSSTTLLYGLLLESGNDAAVALAEGLCGSETVFVNEMNLLALDLGMSGSHFMNCSGLPDEDHYSTARDMATLMCACTKDVDLLRIMGTRSYSDEGHSFQNHNKLLWQLEECDGGKTGYTKSAGRCLVSSACFFGRRFICVTLNDPADWQDHASFYELAKCRFVTARVEQRALSVFIPCAGCENQVFCSPDSGILVHVPDYLLDNISVRFSTPQFLYPEISSGSTIGNAEILAGGCVLGRKQLYASDPPLPLPERPGLWERIKTWVLGLFCI